MADSVKFQSVRGLLTTAEMSAEMRIWHSRWEIVSPMGAATIASWWQSPGTWSGAVFAAFASGCEVSREDLNNATDAEIAVSHPDDEDAHAYLNALKAWVTAPLCATCGRMPQQGGFYGDQCVTCYYE